MTARPARRRLLRRLAALALGLLAALLLAELGLRILGLPRSRQEFVVDHRALPDVFVEDRDTFWRLAPDNRVYVANRLGLRGPCPEGEKAPGELRLVCVGDSSTFGFGHSYEAAYGPQLGRMLQHAFPSLRVETLLAALPAFSTYQNRVQFERDVVALAPDVTVLYCGAWNDLMAAIGLSDAARATRNRARASIPWFSLRLVQLAARALEATDLSDDIDTYVHQRPDGARVPEAEFVANLRALIDMAREAGSLVVVVVPPHAKTIERSSELALQYRELARATAEAARALTLDAPALLRDDSDGIYGPWFDDGIHPSRAGHRRLAEGLFELLQPALTSRAPASDPSGPALRELSFLPSSVELFADRTMQIAGPGLSERDRVWIGDRWMPAVRLVDGELRVDLGPLRTVGDRPVEVVTDAGLARLARPLHVLPPRLVIERSTGRAKVVVRGRGPAGWLVALWVSPARRDSPAATAYGPFLLADDSPEPFDIEATSLPRHLVTIGDDRTWRLELDATDLGPTDWLQALFLDPEDPARGVLSVPTSASSSD